MSCYLLRYIVAACTTGGRQPAKVTLERLDDRVKNSRRRSGLRHFLEKERFSRRLQGTVAADRKSIRRSTSTHCAVSVVAVSVVDRPSFRRLSPLDLPQLRQVFSGN